MRGLAGATRWLLLGLDMLFLLLITVTAITSAAASHGAWPVALCGGGFLALYAVGRSKLAPQPRPLDSGRARLWPDGVWLGALTACWVWLMALTGQALWLAFPLMLLALHALGPRWGVTAVAALSVLAVAPQLSRIGSWADLAPVLGPLIGAAVAVGVVLGLEALAREAHEKQQLINELSAAHDYLAEAERERAVLGERERLAREIHDTLAQGFSGIELLLRAARAQLPDSPAAQLIDTAAETARDNLTEARRFVRALAPAELDGDTLVAALRREAERVRLRAPQLDVSFEVLGEPTALPMPVEAALLRIAQSALGNVVQHAAATSARLVLDYAEAEIRLSIADDGAGFVEGARSPGGGFGIPGMRSRVRELCGTLTVVSVPGEGTTVQVTIPKEQE